MEPNRSPSTPDSSVLYCAQCGSEAKSSQLFCAACGAPLASTIESPPLTQKPASNEPFSSMAPPLPDFRFEAQPDPDFPYTITPVFLSEEEAFVRQKP